MRRSHLFAVGAVVVLLLGVTGVIYSKYQKTAAAYAQMQTDNENTRIRYGQAINDIAMIQDSLNSIVLGEEEARLIPSKLQDELRLSENHGDEEIGRASCRER